MRMTWSETQKAEGRGEGVREILLLQLAERFGPLPESVHVRIEETGLQQLRRLAKRLLTAHSLAEMGLA